MKQIFENVSISLTRHLWKFFISFVARVKGNECLVTVAGTAFLRVMFPHNLEMKDLHKHS